MSICTPCIRLKPVSICTDSIVIGTVASFNTVYHIYFVSLANGMVVHYTATSNGAGLLVLTPTDGFILATDHLYEVYVNKTQSVSEGENLTIGATTATCYQVSFIEVWQYNFVSQTFEIA